MATLSVPSNTLSDVGAATSDSNVQAALVAIAYYESGWNAGAIGDYTLDCQTFYTAATAPAGAWPTSFGYLQMHNGGDGGQCAAGLGAGYSSTQLLDGQFNMSLGAGYISNRLANGASMYDAMSPWSTRDEAYALYQQIVAQGGIGGGGGSTSGGGSTGGGGASSAGATDWQTLLWIVAGVLFLDEVLD